MKLIIDFGDTKPETEKAVVDLLVGLRVPFQYVEAGNPPSLPIPETAIKTPERDWFGLKVDKPAKPKRKPKFRRIIVEGRSVESTLLDYLAANKRATTKALTKEVTAYHYHRNSVCAGLYRLRKQGKVERLDNGDWALTAQGRLV